MKLIDRIVTNIVALSGYIFFHLLCKGNIYNEQAISATKKQHKKFIVALNHESYLDWIIIWSIFRYRHNCKVIFLAKKKLFDHSFWGMIMRHAKCIRVSNNGLKILDKDVFKNQTDSVIGIFPEGKRTRTGKMEEFRTGVAVMSWKMNVPVLPITLNGFYQAWGPNKNFPKPYKLDIVVGNLIYPNRTQNTREQLQTIRQSIIIGKSPNNLDLKNFNIAVFDMDKTLSNTSIADLLIFIKKKELSATEYRIWLYSVSLTIPLLKLLDKIYRPIVQIIVYSLYPKMDEAKLLQYAKEFVDENQHKIFIRPTIDFAESLTKCGIPKVIISTNLSALTQIAASHLNFDCGYGISISTLQKLNFIDKIKYLSLFKKTILKKINYNKILGIGDSRYDRPIFNHSEYSILVCRKNSREKLAYYANNYISWTT